MNIRVYKTINELIWLTVFSAWVCFAFLLTEEPALQINKLERKIIEDEQGHLIVDATREVCATKDISIEIEKRVVNDKTKQVFNLQTSVIKLKKGCSIRHSNFYLPDSMTKGDYVFEATIYYKLNLIINEHFVMPITKFSKPYSGLNWD